MTEEMNESNCKQCKHSTITNAGIWCEHKQLMVTKYPVCEHFQYEETETIRDKLQKVPVKIARKIQPITPSEAHHQATRHDTPAYIERQPIQEATQQYKEATREHKQRVAEINNEREQTLQEYEDTIKEYLQATGQQLIDEVHIIEELIHIRLEPGVGINNDSIEVLRVISEDISVKPLRGQIEIIINIGDNDT